MAENTPISRKFLGNTTEELSALHGKEKQLVIDTVKNTAVVMDGSTAGGHPLAKEAVKIKSGTDGIKINDGTESNLASDITITADPSVCITLHEGQIDFDDPEQIEEITENLPNGQLVASDCCDNCPDDAVYINGNWNTEEWLTEGGEYEVPVTGWFNLLLIGGGAGAHVNWSSTNRNWYAAVGGYSGSYIHKNVFLEKGSKIPVIIGAAGENIIFDNSVTTLGIEALRGGDTYFGEYKAVGGIWMNDNNPEWRGLPGVAVWQPGVNCDGPGYLLSANAAGGGFGAGMASVTQNYDVGFYGCGATARSDGGLGSLTEAVKFNSAQPGAIRLRYYDAAKDKNISIDMASSVTIKELQDQIATLAAKVQELENE